MHSAVRVMFMFEHCIVKSVVPWVYWSLCGFFLYCVIMAIQSGHQGMPFNSSRLLGTARSIHMLEVHQTLRICLHSEYVPPPLSQKFAIIWSVYNLLTSRWLQRELRYGYPRFELAHALAIKIFPSTASAGGIRLTRRVGLRRVQSAGECNTLPSSGYRMYFIYLDHVSGAPTWTPLWVPQRVIKVPHSICKPSTNTRLTKVILTQEWRGG